MIKRFFFVATGFVIIRTGPSLRGEGPFKERSSDFKMEIALGADVGML
jgi:hypothetical protein